MNWWPHHHPACFCWVCRGKVGHPANRCHCGRCLDEWKVNVTRFSLEGLAPQRISAAQWDDVVPHIAALQAAGYYVSPVGEIEGDVYVEVEAEAVGMWREMTGGQP